MPNRTSWSWSFVGPKGAFRGVVEAVDARDAFSRAMTSETPGGRLFGDEHGVPLAALTAAPGNLQPYEWKGDLCVLRVKPVAMPVSSSPVEEAR